MYNMFSHLEVRCGNTATLRASGKSEQIPLRPPEPVVASPTSIVLLSPGVVVVPSTTVPLLSPEEVVVWSTNVRLLLSMDDKEEKEVVSKSAIDDKEEKEVVSEGIVPSTAFSVVLCVAGNVVVGVSSEDAVASVDVVVVVLVVGHADGAGVIVVVLNPLH